jgi:ElaA protein
VTTEENTRSSDARPGDAGPPDPLPWLLDARAAVLADEMLGVTPQVRHGRWSEVSALTAHALARLRVDVLVAEVGHAHPELDDQDVAAGTEHLWISDTDLVVAYLRLVRQQDGTPYIDRACARADVRALGLIGALVTEVVARHGADQLRAVVATDSLPYFLQHGFEVSGPPVDLPGGPHFPMARRAEAPWRA